MRERCARGWSRVSVSLQGGRREREESRGLVVGDKRREEKRREESHFYCPPHVLLQWECGLEW